VPLISIRYDVLAPAHLNSPALRLECISGRLECICGCWRALATYRIFANSYGQVQVQFTSRIEPSEWTTGVLIV
jgi:hypothetical protein